MAFTVVTYGGGEVLAAIFDAIAMLINGNSNGLIRPLMMLTATIAGFWACAKALIFPSYEGIVLKFVFPLLCITGCFMIPTATVHIEDVLAKEGTKSSNKLYVVDNVPLFLAKFAEIVSTFGYKITQAVETIMHVPQDMSYNATGMVFGSATALDATKYRLTNGILEQDLRQFARQCVLYDVALNKYSIDDLKKSSDLWKLFESQTSKVRMIDYRDPSTRQVSYLTCQEAIQKLKPFFAKEIDYYVGLDILGNLPLTFQALTNLKKDKEELIGQQLMMSFLAKEFNGEMFAKARADAQNQTVMQLTGTLSSEVLVRMRNIIEALIYIGFLFVIPLSILPGGLNLISNWAWLLVQIQIWPPLYAILNYIIQLIARQKSAGIFNGLSQDQMGISFFTNIGLNHLHQNMMALTGVLIASVPFISYLLTKGGVHAFTNMTSSMLSPMQNAASTAANEQVTGNYSFANTSFGQMSYQNSSGFQSNLAPSISDGYFTDNQGSSTKIYAPDENILQQNSSRLRTSLSLNTSDSQTIQRCEQEAQSLVETQQNTYLESVANHGKATADLSEHLAYSTNYQEGLSSRESQGLQESLSYVQNMAENWGKQYGLNTRESTEALASVAIGGEIGFGKWFSASGKAGGGYNLSASRDDMLNSALAISQSSGFQSHMQNVDDIATSQNFSEGSDQGSRFMTAYGESLDQLRSSQDSHQAALSHSKQISDNAAWLRQNGSSINQSLDQDFINWAQKEYGGLEQIDDILSKGSPKQRQNLVENFMQDFRPVSLASENLSEAYQNTKIQHVDYEPSQMIEGFHQLNESKSEELTNQKAELMQKSTAYKDKYQGSKEEVSGQISSNQERTIEEFDNKNGDYLVGRVAEKIIDKFSAPKNVSNQYHVVQKPFWIED